MREEINVQNKTPRMEIVFMCTLRPLSPRHVTHYMSIAMAVGRRRMNLGMASG